MKINLARSAGFCFGVRRAIEIALKTAKEKKSVFMLGDIVHNEEVVRQIGTAGIRKIKGLGNGKNKTLLIRAHGSSLSTINKARRSGYQVVDATCPMVKEIHKIVRRMSAQSYRIIIIGDKKHDEVQGIAGQLKGKAIIIESPQKIPLEALKKIKKACVVVQSTQNLQQVLKIVSLLKGYIPDLQFFNTICKPTRLKQEEIRRIPLENDVTLIIGSRNSANTKRLYQISRALNRRSYWVSSKKEIKKEWFKNASRIGVSAGASTPESTIKSIIAYLKRIK
jgi:4-hydroxy-3-methylbut-2-enyl diphosphate reductase